MSNRSDLDPEDSEKSDLDPEDFEWGMRADGGIVTQEEESLLKLDKFEFPTVSRQRMSAVGISLIVVMSMILAFTGGATANTTFTATNVDVTSNGGNLKSLTVAPAGNITYDGFDHKADKVVIEVQIEESDGNWTTVATEEKNPTKLQGNVSYDFTTIDVISTTDWKKTDFKAKDDGSTNTTNMNVRVTANFVNATNSGANVTSSASDTFDVTVTNEQATSGIGGNANTGGN